MEVNVSYEKLHAVQEGLSKGVIAIVKDDLNAKVRSDNTLLTGKRHLVGKKFKRC